MADGGKKRVKREDHDTMNSKRIKQEETSADAFWEWEDDGHNWTKFDDVLNKEIEEAFKSGVQKTKLLISDKKFEVIFDRMVQRNSITCWERRIRANKNGEDGGLSGTYCFVNAIGESTLYDNSVQRLIYAAKCYNIEQVNFVLKSQKYTINLKKMEQVNTKTKKVLKLYVNQQSIPSSEIKNESVEDIKKQASDMLSEENSKPSKAKKSQAIASELKSVTFKGKCPVDSHCPHQETYYVYFEGANVYDAMLNQTNLKNNNNKFFLLQLLKSNTGNSFAVWFRWGRVGLAGQKNFINCGTDLEEAKQLFCKKFFDKTKNEFADRGVFVKVSGKYDLIKMDYSANVKDEVDAPLRENNVKKTIPDSKLHKKLQSLIELICDVKLMEEAVIEMKYDTKKAPLGKLTKDQIKAGYKALQKIDHCITNNIKDDKLILACDAFYTRIPHCFGMQRPPVIKTKQELKSKIQLLEALGDIEIALKVINEKSNNLLNPIDQHYAALQCNLEPLCHTSDEFKMITTYTQNTHAKTHNQYKMEVTDIFVCSDEKQTKNFIDVGNRMLLWHGSRLTNWVGILSQGLRIAPPEAPVTGYMFGKGVYFADVSSKSANYCYPTRTKNVGFVLLCEVSLGKVHELLDADYKADKLPDGYHSTKGVGKVACSEKDYITLPDGLIIPAGVLSEVNNNNAKNCTLNYNEYVVYDIRQRKLPPKNPLWSKSFVTDFKRNCSIKRSGLVRHILSQHFYPVYKRYNLEVPRQCIFMRERNIYHQIEAGKTELSAGHIKCEFCGKLFLNEDYFNAHVDKKHAKVYVFNKDSVCLSDYCDIFRCDLHEMFPINQADFGLCQKKHVRELQRKCEKIIYTCLPPEMQHYIYDSLSKSLCAPLNCDNFYSDFEDISVWYIAYMLMLIPATALLFLLALWCCNEYSNNVSEDIVFRDKYEKERFENTILKGGGEYYISCNHVRRR